jgi:hypothetical protein
MWSFSSPIIYDHIHWKTRDPIRSPIDKPARARVVVESVTISEFLVLYVMISFWAFFKFRSDSFALPMETVNKRLCTAGPDCDIDYATWCKYCSPRWASGCINEGGYLATIGRCSILQVRERIVHTNLARLYHDDIVSNWLRSARRVGAWSKLVFGSV